MTPERYRNEISRWEDLTIVERYRPLHTHAAWLERRHDSARIDRFQMLPSIQDPTMRLWVVRIFLNFAVTLQRMTFNLVKDSSANESCEMFTLYIIKQFIMPQHKSISHQEIPGSTPGQLSL
jgi:hypothetical protein